MGSNNMSDEPIKGGEFNAAMKSQKDVISSLSERIASIETLLQANLVAEIAKAKEAGKREARQEELEKRLNRIEGALWVIGLGFLANLLWWAFGKLAGGRDIPVGVK